jgi:AcrR family transcriptional regulator
MNEAKTDKRVRRTEQALESALVELIVERGYERLSVQHLLDRAGVGRATFYTHYRSKEDLLRRGLDQLRDRLIEEWKSATVGKPDSEDRLGFSLAFFRHVDGHRRLYRAIVGRESGIVVDRQMRRLLADLLRAKADSPGRPERNTVRTEMATQYVVGALMSTVTWWLERNPKLSPEEIDSAFRQMTLPALQASSHI